MECDELTISLKRKNEQLRQCQMRMTKLEVSLAKTNQAVPSELSTEETQQNKEPPNKKPSMIKQVGASLLAQL